MNTPNPLIPQGSLLEQQKTKGKSNLFIAVFMILAVHVVVFAGLLMQGCGREKDAHKPDSNAFTFTNTTSPAPGADTGTLAPAPSLGTGTGPTNFVPDTTTPPPAVATTLSNPPPASAPAITELAVTPPPAAGKEYTVAKGDMFYTIAKAQGISVNALVKANPGVNPRKLHAGQKLVIPAPEPAAAPAASTPAATEPTANPDVKAATTYTVKTGDNLTKIARAHGTTAKAIQSLNGLKSNQIHVGQKLKMPAAKTAAASAPAKPAPAL